MIFSLKHKTKTYPFAMEKGPQSPFSPFTLKNTIFIEK